MTTFGTGSLYRWQRHSAAALCTKIKTKWRDSYVLLKEILLHFYFDGDYICIVVYSILYIFPSLANFVNYAGSISEKTKLFFIERKETETCFMFL